MKQMIKLFALLTALCLFAGCTANTAQTEPIPTDPIQTEPIQTDPAQPETTEAEEPDASDADTSTTTETETAAMVGEPEGWEEEWPEEYPVTSYRVLEGAIRQSGRLNKYRYEQLPGAETYMERIADYVRQAYDCGYELTMQEDSPHDGYANWFMEAPKGSASVSGSSITGRFCFGLYPKFNRILEMTEQTISDRDGMEQAAWAFVQRFSDITGELVLVKSEEDTQYYHDERSSDFRDVTVPALRYIFCSASVSEVLLEIQDGLPAPVACGDSSIEDLNVHCFTVTVWPDGTVVRGDNYITKAQLTLDGSVRMLDEGDLPELLSYMTSLAENDTLVIEEVRADRFNVYFGYAAVDPILTVKYHFESDPTEERSTEFSMGLFGED